MNQKKRLCFCLLYSKIATHSTVNQILTISAHILVGYIRDIKNIGYIQIGIINDKPSIFLLLIN